MPREAVWGHGVRARRRYLGLVGLFYVVWSPTVPKVPRGRSGAAAGAGRTVAQILYVLKIDSEGKGLRLKKFGMTPHVPHCCSNG